MTGDHGQGGHVDRTDDVQGLSGTDMADVFGDMPAVSGGEVEAVAADLWRAVGYVNRYGDVAQAWTVPLPAAFVDRLVNDPEALEQEVADRVAAVGGTLLECGPMMVDGRLGYYRIVRLPDGYLPAAVYVAGLVVPVEDASPIQRGIEITITSSALGELLISRTD